MRVVAASNALGAFWSTTSQGLPVADLFEAWASGGDEAVMHVAHNYPQVIVDRNPETLFGLQYDILIPAARTSVIAARNEIESVRTENPHVVSVEDVAAATGVALIAEAANHPLTPGAKKFCRTHGIGVLRDVEINCGGLIGCWDEWRARRVHSTLRTIEEALIEVRRRVAQAKSIVEGDGGYNGELVPIGMIA